MKDNAIELSTRLTRADVAGLIEALVEGLKEGCLKVQKSDACLTLDVPRVVDLEVRAEQDAERAVFRVEVSWRATQQDVPDVDMPSACPQEEAPVPVAKSRAPKSPAKKKTGTAAAKPRTRST